MVKILLRRKLAFVLAATLTTTLLPSTGAIAETPLTRAVVQSVRNTVRLVLRNQSPRPAKVRDALVPGDALSTARLALAELRFNDGSLARVGEQALFQFLPNTRTFRLNSGTVLLLIPPGRGQTRLQTPNAVAGIRGSALFIRYLPDTDTTVVGALTTSGIVITNRDRTQTQPLNAGQMAVVVKDRIERVYDFDLRTFYETSDLVQGLSLSKVQPGATDAAIAAVRSETIAAINAQKPLAASAPVQNSDFLKLPDKSGTAESTFPSPADLTILQPSTVSQPSTFPPTVAIPLSPGAIGSSSNPGDRRGSGQPEVPGLTGATPGISVPGQTGTAPGQGETGSPGQTGTTPGQTGTPPGQGENGPPGQTGTAPGLAGTTPGQSGAAPPGQAGTTPGQSGNTPGNQGGNNLLEVTGNTGVRGGNVEQNLSITTPVGGATVTSPARR